MTMRVLWFCNRPVLSPDTGGTGTWLDALAHQLIKVDGLELGVVTHGVVKRFTRDDHPKLAQWVVPCQARPGRDGLPAGDIVQAIRQAVLEFAPDLVHVWGTESYWGLLTGRGLITQPAVLNLQGLKYSIAPVFNGGLSAVEQLACIGLKELLRGTSIFQQQRAFARWGVFEREMIASHRQIICSSAWHKQQVAGIDPTIRLYDCAIPLREPFTTADPWQPPGGYRVFCSSAYPAPFKGLHVALQALALVKRVLPDIHLCIAGMAPVTGIRRDGYLAWVQRAIRRLRLENSVTWLGTLSAVEVVAELHAAAAMVLPTYIESVGVSLHEAMMIGTPTTASFVGGLQSAAQDGVSCLFFPPGDAMVCAANLSSLLTDSAFALNLSRQSRAVAQQRNGTARIVATQLAIYRHIIDGALNTFGTGIPIPSPDYS